MKCYPGSFIFLCAFMLVAGIRGTAQVPAFTIPDSACVNTPVPINNTSTGGTSWYWNFCVADLNQTTPAAVNLGNPGGVLSSPVFIDIVSDNNNYYGFLVNHAPGGLVRLDFGNSLLNAPTVTNLGNFGGLLPAVGNEGVQVIKNKGRWYAIIVGGGPESATTPHIVRVDIGPVITNPAPVGTDWGNPPGANLSMPIDLYLFTDNSNNWYGFTGNADNNTITLFNFGNDLANTPTATNLGNPGNLLNYPDGIFALNDGGSWHVFVTNGGNGTITRLDFGNSLLNTPSAVDLGNPGGTLIEPRDITIMKFCDQVVGFVVNFGNNELVKLDFNNDLLSIPAGTSTGNIGNFDFPHSISKLFRVDADLYCFIPNVYNNTLTRLKFGGCTNSSIPNSAAKDPPAITYSVPGTYHINLMMDEGLATQASFCKSVVVVGPPAFSLGNDTALCQGDSLILRYKGPTFSYAWQDGSLLDSFVVHSTGQYRLAVTATRGCTTTDTVAVQFRPFPVISSIPDTSICKGTSLLLTTTLQFQDGFGWTPADGLTDPSVLSPLVKPSVPTQYVITASDHVCLSRDTIRVSLKDTPVISTSADTLICSGRQVQLWAVGADPYHYLWSPARGLTDPTVPSPAAWPDSSTWYHVLATGANKCTTLDSVLVAIKRPDTFRISPARSQLCLGDSVLLQATGGDGSLGDTYEWLLSQIPWNPSSPAIQVWPGTSTAYPLVGYDKICDRRDTITAFVKVFPRPTVTMSKSNDIDCILGEATLSATGGRYYTWSPSAGLSNPNSSSPVARTDTSTLYYVEVMDTNRCVTKDSITVLVGKGSGSIGNPVANAFTPNGDGHNDCFGIKYWGYIGQFEMSIFNRQGARVFYCQDPYQCWDGRYRGQMQPTGTYVYMIQAKTLCGNVFRKGTVLLLR